MVFSPDRRESGPDLQSASSRSPREWVLAPGHGHEKKRIMVSTVPWAPKGLTTFVLDSGIF
jgi:hypothetical protein